MNSRSTTWRFTRSAKADCDAAKRSETGNPIQQAPSFPRRIAAFALDYLLIAGYLVVLAAVGSFLALGLFKDGWKTFVSSPWRADLIAFVTAILPVILYFTLLESSAGGATWGKRWMRMRVAGRGGDRLGRGRALARSVVKFLPWQIAHTCMFHFPGWPTDAQTPPAWVTVGLVLVWVLVGFYVVTLVVSPTRRAPYDWIAGSRVVVTE